MNRKLITRRKVLMALGLLGFETAHAGFSLNSLLSALVSGQISKAQARAIENKIKSENARNFVQLNMYGAPSRYFFDHPLRPNDTDAFIATHGMYNIITDIDFDKPHLTKGAYTDSKIRGINMPHLWNYDVAKAGGETRPMQELMSNMLMIRGCMMGSDGHPINCEKQVSPVSGDFSITGLVADNSTAFFPSVSLGQSPANKAFRSPRNASAVEIPLNSSDYISYLLEVFYSRTAQSQVFDENTEIKIEQALGILKNYGLSNKPGSEIIYNERAKIEKFVRNGVRDFSDASKALTEKYDELFNRSLSLSQIKGVTDSKLPGLKFPITVPGSARMQAALSAHKFDHFTYIANSDVRDLFSKVKAENLAKSFALAEFILTEGLSSSILLVPPAHDRGNLLVDVVIKDNLYNFSQIEHEYNANRNETVFKLKKGAQFSVDQKPIFITDSHGSGWMTHVVACNLFYRGFSSCLLELFDQLKLKKISNSTSLFDETVFQYATEFERAPADGGGATQHNFLGCATSLFSGTIKKPEVIGNIYTGKVAPVGTSLPAGTIGTAAPIQALGNKKISISHISSTLSEMLRVPKVSKRAESLVEIRGGTLKTRIEAGKNIDEEA